MKYAIKLYYKIGENYHVFDGVELDTSTMKVIDNRSQEERNLLPNISKEHIDDFVNVDLEYDKFKRGDPSLMRYS